MKKVWIRTSGLMAENGQEVHLWKRNVGQRSSKDGKIICPDGAWISYCMQKFARKPVLLSGVDMVKCSDCIRRWKRKKAKIEEMIGNG